MSEYTTGKVQLISVLVDELESLTIERRDKLQTLSEWFDSRSRDLHNSYGLGIEINDEEFVHIMNTFHYMRAELESIRITSNELSDSQMRLTKNSNLFRRLTGMAYS